MIQRSDEALLRWATGVLGEGLVRLGPPPAIPVGRGVALHLLDITPDDTASVGWQRTVRATLRFAAIAWAETTPAAHQLLDNLMFAAMQHPLVQLDRRRAPATMWQSLDRAPMPGLLLRWDGHHAPLPPADGLPARTIYATTPASHLSGRVVGPDGRAVDHATVAVPRYEMRARTDDAGRFKLPALPSQEPVTLVVHANGREEQLRLVQAGGRGAGVIIQIGS